MKFECLDCQQLFELSIPENASYADVQEVVMKSACPHCESDKFTHWVDPDTKIGANFAAFSSMSTDDKKRHLQKRSRRHTKKHLKDAKIQRDGCYKGKSIDGFKKLQ